MSLSNNTSSHKIKRQTSSFFVWQVLPNRYYDTSTLSGCLIETDHVTST